MNKNNSGGGDETRLFTPPNLEKTKSEPPSGSGTPRPSGSASPRPSGSASQHTAGQGQTRPTGSASQHPSKPAQLRPTGSASQRPSRPAQLRPPGSVSQHPEGQRQTRPPGSTSQRPSGAASQHPAGQIRPMRSSEQELDRTRRLNNPADENNRTRIMQTVQPTAKNGQPKSPDNAGRTKTIYNKDDTQNTSVMNKVGTGYIRTPADQGSQTRLINAVVPVNGGNPRKSPAAPVHYRGNKPGSPARRPSKRDYNNDGGEAVTGALTSVMKAIIYIVFVLVVSGFLSYFGISVCNDVFAFVKSDDETEIIIPEFATLNDIAEILKENDIISFPSVFKLYAKLRRDSGEYLAGQYTVTPSMNYDMLLSDFKPQVKPRAEVSITIPEGYSVDQIIELFISNGMGTKEEFKNVIENGDFSEYNINWFVAEIDANKSPDRKYRLEGYLFPDTYYFYSDSDEYTIIYKLLKNFYTKFDESYKARCQELGYTVDEIITLASMVQAEAKFASEYTLVSSVFHNRLNNPSGPTQGRLESDPTVQYMLPEHKSILTQAETAIESPYNTYIHKGLPPGPICNPGLNAIQYALYPAETDYLFFVANSSGYHLFAATYDEHIMNKIAPGN
ncbi:MAG: endolytic transglycosylase MltG [Eubacteriales bacterium]